MAGEDALFEIGEIVAEAYEIRSVLGEGGMGRVYAAHDLALSRKVAVKASWPSIDRAFLLKEAQALASIRHPGMIDVYAAGTHRDIAYIVMEYLYGVNLETFVLRRRADSPKLGVDEVLDVLIPVADVLAAIHRSGLAHRDVKPANVMLTPNGRIVLMDLGLVQVESEVTARISGTPEYMAPEALMGAVDPRTAFLVDVYALGITAYELLTGEVPFIGESAVETIEGHLKRPVPDLRAARPDVPARLAGLVSEMLAKEPLERPPSMEAVLFRMRAARNAARAVAPVPAPLPSSSSVAPPPLEARDATFKVLVVDDDAALAKLLGLYAKRAVPDADIVVVGDAEQALASVRERPPHVMLMDLHMPRINGIELCMMLRGMHLADDCTILAVSAGAREADIELLRQLGITKFIPKGADLSARLLLEVRAVHEQWQRAARASRPPSRSPSLAPPATRSIVPPSTSAKIRAATEVRSAPRIDAERLCRTIARALPSASLVLFDRNLRVVVAEGDWFGASDVPPRSGDARTLAEVVPPAHLAKMRAPCEASLEGASGDVKIDAGSRQFRVRIEPVADDGGEIVYGVAVAVEAPGA